MKDISKLSQDISKWANRIDEKVVQAVEDTAKDVYNDIMNLAPVGETGRYKESIKIDNIKRDNNKVSIEIYTDMVLESKLLHKRYNLGRLLENGTNPHLILPVEPDGVLHFIDKEGNDVFTRLVQHPGTKEQPHFSPALRKNRRNFKKKLKLAIKEAKK